jgi:predicted nucleic acid-binding Zn ribbon protein
VAIGSVAAGLVERRQWADRLEGSRIHDVWPEVAGPAVADHVVPLRLHGGVLVLQADSGAWATQIRYLSQQIMDRANEVLGAGKVSQVQITSVTRRR